MTSLFPGQGSPPIVDLVMRRARQVCSHADVLRQATLALNYIEAAKPGIVARIHDVVEPTDEPSERLAPEIIFVFGQDRAFPTNGVDLHINHASWIVSSYDADKNNGRKVGFRYFRDKYSNEDPRVHLLNELLFWLKQTRLIP